MEYNTAEVIMFKQKNHMPVMFAVRDLLLSSFITEPGAELSVRPVFELLRKVAARERLRKIPRSKRRKEEKAHFQKPYKERKYFQAF